MTINESLKLENQLCFPLYAASRLVTQCYQPVLDELGLTYPQYLVLLILWETDRVNLKVLSEKLHLQSNTLTPLLKRMQTMGLIDRVRSQEDERSVIISLTPKGQQLATEAPKVLSRLTSNLGISLEEAQQLHRLLYKLIGSIAV
ncbi:MarR family winged helix-turn-helix transcriptional regulator [Spirosoma sordidisoli]|uniref:MarR family winged helix-turn-helix transcriptional regulator n=1 Tax=Spirosoma sordidisoli TaxID=2502893 RepID=UPI0014787C46|nr:MarR family transcriptional regulator [Spirosoma sordidisoli]